MRPWLLAASLLVAGAARADCTPAPPAAIAEAERLAADAEHKADEAESVSVRSGNPGAARRAEIARHEATEARRRAAAAACKPLPPEPTAPRPSRGY